MYFITFIPQRMCLHWSDDFFIRIHHSHPTFLRFCLTVLISSVSFIAEPNQRIYRNLRGLTRVSARQCFGQAWAMCGRRLVASRLSRVFVLAEHPSLYDLFCHPALPFLHHVSQSQLPHNLYKSQTCCKC